MKMEERDRLIREDGKNTAILSFIEVSRKEGVSETELFTMIQKFFHLTEEEAEILLSE